MLQDPSFFDDAEESIEPKAAATPASVELSVALVTARLLVLVSGLVVFVLVGCWNGLGFRVRCTLGRV